MQRVSGARWRLTLSANLLPCDRQFSKGFLEAAGPSGPNGPEGPLGLQLLGNAVEIDLYRVFANHDGFDDGVHDAPLLFEGEVEPAALDSERPRSRIRWSLGGTTCSSSGSGAPSSRRKSTCAPTPASRRPAPRSARLSPSTMPAARTRALTGKPRTRRTSTRCRQSRSQPNRGGNPRSPVCGFPRATSDHDVRQAAEAETTLSGQGLPQADER